LYPSPRTAARPAAKPGAKPVYQGMAPGSHLTPEELAIYIDGATSRPERRRAVGHLATCDICFGELLAILRLMKNQPGEAGDPP
jgi:hypothetical protein